MAWTIDLQNLAGGVILAGAPWRTGRVSWALDGPGSLEVNLIEADATQWIPGQRRVVLRKEGTAVWAGWLTRLRSEGPPANIRLTASALGLSSVLAGRVVHGDFSKTATVATTIAWNLIQHVQAQTNGDTAFTLGTITGTAPARTRHYCDGDNVREQIDELAAHETGGFDWEISPTGAFNAWVGGRGIATGITVARSAAQDWSVEAEYADVPTYVTVLGEADEPCGAPLEIRSSSLAATYVRREVVIDANSTNTAEMQTLGDGELRARTASRIRSEAGYVTDGELPFVWTAVGLGDRVTIVHPAWFGGSQTMRCTQVDVSIEAGDLKVYQYSFEGF
jgi:hypothetical protein